MVLSRVIWYSLSLVTYLVLVVNARSYIRAIFLKARSTNKIMCAQQSRAVKSGTRPVCVAVDASLCLGFFNNSWDRDKQRLMLLHVRSSSPEGRLGMSDVSPLSGISGLSFDATLLSSLLFSA